jgi:hypothetical protein
VLAHPDADAVEAKSHLLLIPNAAGAQCVSGVFVIAISGPDLVFASSMAR